MLLQERIQRMTKKDRIYLNDDWQFSPTYEEAMLEPDFDGEKLERVRLPHSTTETPFHYFDERIYQKISAYRRMLLPEKSWKGKHVFLTVEAAGHEAEIFLNGDRIAAHHCGYTAFTVDLSEHLLWEQENILVIRVDSRENLNQPPFGNVIDYMTYGGLYREVYLEIREQSYIQDVFAKVTRVETTDGICGNVDLICEAAVDKADGCTLRQEVYELSRTTEDVFEEGIYICALEKSAASGNDPAAAAKRMAHKLEQVKLWHPDHPVLYELRTYLIKEGQILDERRDRIGLRQIDFRADGLYINGVKTKIRGLNRHQSYPYVGYAMPASIQRQDAIILKKELGLNAVRTSHYPQSHHFLDACDELGLLVFTEIPGWQHIGDENWKAQAVENTRDMVQQYRNHPSIFLWGVRINESMDDDELYQRTNAVAHELDDSRPTSGVRYLQKSSLLEDIYAYNDFSHDGTNAGVLNRRRVTPDGKKGYLISEYNGHMFPTKSFDGEDHRTEHMRRHAKVLDGYYGQKEVAGGFGWCMADYNTHKDFGSGDRICYHGVLDMFRNPKLAAYVYAAQKEPGCFESALVRNVPDSPESALVRSVPDGPESALVQKAPDSPDVVLEISSSMDIGEHPACQSKGIYAITNADSVRVYKNDLFVGEYRREHSPYKKLPHGPIYIDDFIGDLMEKGEGFSHSYAEDMKKILIAANKFGMTHLPLHILLLAAKLMLCSKMKISDAVSLYNKYVANWGGSVTTYRFEAVQNGKVVKTVEKKPVNSIALDVKVSHTVLVEENTYDVAAVRVRAVDGSGATLPFYQEPLFLEAEGPIRIIGPGHITLRGGMGGTYVKTVGESGKALLRIRGEHTETTEIIFEVK